MADLIFNIVYDMKHAATAVSFAMQKYYIWSASTSFRVAQKCLRLHIVKKDSVLRLHIQKSRILGFIPLWRVSREF